MAFPAAISSPHLPLKKELVLSSLLHFILILFILFAPALPLFKPEVKVLWVELPKGTLEEVDLKIKESPSLPQTTIKEQKEWLKETKKEAAKLKPKSKQQTEIEKALAALAKRKPAPPEAAQVKEKGEGFKYGTGITPLRVPPSDPEYIAYQAKVRFKIIQEWILPLAYLEGSAPPKAKMVVHINEQGEILSKEWDSKSGNEAFDASCERAVSRASPLPTPPERLKWEAYNEGFLVEFDPSLKGP